MTLHCGDCLEVMRGMPDNSVDLVLTDPPYGLAFMGKKWDYDVPAVEVWAEALRVLKPGGHLLAFAGTRTQHRMACRIEDAGFEIRDMLAWVYGSGFPKSLDVSKAIDKAAGAQREVVGQYNGASNIGRKSEGKWGYGADGTSNIGADRTVFLTSPATDAAREWDGWGTALKPALEPITMARKPLVGTVADNVMQYGTGGLNIDACRVGTEPMATHSGRWPANLIHDGSEDSAAPMGSAARFFYTAKASKRERGENNNHPTVKPIALMEYLCNLASRPGAVVLDPFMGSGTTGIACRNLGRQFIGIERDPDYFKLAEARISHTPEQMEIPA